MQAIYTDRLVSPIIRELAELRQATHAARINRKLSNHTDPVQNHPHGLKHQYRIVPTGGYFLAVPSGTGTVELCASTRTGRPLGAPFRVKLAQYRNLLTSRCISPVPVYSEPPIYHVPPEQWQVIRRAMQAKPETVDMSPRRRDPLRKAHNARFHSFADLRRTLGLPTVR